MSRRFHYPNQHGDIAVTGLLGIQLIRERYVNYTGAEGSALWPRALK
jgi:hypothetical protein